MRVIVKQTGIQLELSLVTVSRPMTPLSSTTHQLRLTFDPRANFHIVTGTLPETVFPTVISQAVISCILAAIIGVSKVVKLIFVISTEGEHMIAGKRVTTI
jgi:hypothetical protein